MRVFNNMFHGVFMEFSGNGKNHLFLLHLCSTWKHEGGVFGTFSRTLDLIAQNTLFIAYSSAL